MFIKDNEVWQEQLTERANLQFLLNAGFVALGLYVASKVLNVDLGSKVADSLDANTPPSPPGGKYALMTPGPTNVSQKDDLGYATQSFD